MSLAPRRTLLSLLVAGAALAPARAHAQPVTQPFAGGQLRLQLEVADDEGAFVDITASEERQEEFFNLAHCLCSTDNDGDGVSDSVQGRFRTRLSFETQPPAPPDDLVELYVGAGCEAVETRDKNCTKTGSDYEVNQITQVLSVDHNLLDLVAPATGTCEEIDEQRELWVAFVDNDDTFSDSATFSFQVDTLPPNSAPRFTRATGSEAALSLSWDLPDADEDVQFWQVLCARADGTPARTTPSGLAPRWITAQSVCGLPDLPTIEAVEAPAPPGEPAVEPTLDDLPDELLALEPDLLCGETAGTATSIRIDGLENGEPYYVVLLAVDDFGNAAGVTNGFALLPRPVTDFWEDVEDGGEGPDGGFCLIADTYGDRGGPGGALTEALRAFRDDTLAASAAGRWLIDTYYEAGAPLAELARQSIVARVILAIVLLPVAALALAWHALGLPALLAALALVAWRRRLTRAARRLAPLARLALTGAAAVAVVGVAPAAATAQTFAPYWEAADAATETDVDPAQINWNFGVKVGPYLPSIDEGLGEDPGPYERFFNERSTNEALPVVELDWLFWKPPGGQLGVGLSAGVMGKSGRAFTAEGTRSDGDYTRFRMVPVAATLIYRLTALDDEYGIPVVPYVRGGLSYYLWWVLAPSGKLARSYPCDVDAGEMCAADTAIGASAGAQGSIGIAIRAEDIDASAAQSMRLSGLYHAGFYVEASLAWVDGFGNDKKLSLGDTTWFAGINFEF